MNLFNEIFICPITQEYLKNPVLTATGQTYEEEDINEWLKNNNTDPITRNIFLNKTLIPNLFVKNLLEKRHYFNENDFTCPLTNEVINYPVTTSCGYTYERAVLEAHFQRHGDIDPVKQKPIILINGQKFLENFCAKNCLDEYKKYKVIEQQKYQALKEAIAQKNMEKVKAIEEKFLNSFFEAQNLEEQKKLLNFAVDNFEGQLSYNWYNLIGDDANSLIFFDICERIQKKIKNNFHFSFIDSYTIQTIPKNLNLLKENLNKQKKFRDELIQNIAQDPNYSIDDLLFFIDSKDESGDTLLHYAVKNNNQALILWLLKNKAEINSKNAEGETPLEWAIKNNHLDRVKILMGHGVDNFDQEKLPNNKAKRFALKINKNINLVNSSSLFFKIIMGLPNFIINIIIKIKPLKEKIEKERIKKEELVKIKQSFNNEKPNLEENRKEKDKVLREKLLESCTPINLFPSVSASLEKTKEKKDEIIHPVP